MVVPYYALMPQSGPTASFMIDEFREDMRPTPKKQSRT